MLWTLVYIIIIQGGSTIETTTWQTALSFRTQQDCTDAADKATPGVLASAPVSIGPDGVGGPQRNAVTLRAACFPTPVSLR